METCDLHEFGSQLYLCSDTEEDSKVELSKTNALVCDVIDEFDPCSDLTD